MDFQQQDDTWTAFRQMAEKERLALRRCAQYQMEQDEDLEEIGTSDVSCHAVVMLRCGEWPENRVITCKCGKVEEIPLGVLVDYYSTMVQEEPTCSPTDAMNEISMCNQCAHNLPEWAYDGKHLLDLDAAARFNNMARLFT